MSWFYILLILPGVICAYFFFLRPVLAAIPQLKTFYSEADGFWNKVSALGWHSLTIAWSYFLAVVGIGAQWLEPAATAAGDPDFKQQITQVLQMHPRILGYVLMGISAITIAARLRSITKG